MNIPAQCHLWRKERVTSEDLNSRGFERVKVYEDDSHFSRDLRRCRECGQLYLFEFYETIDWEHGNDPQYLIYLPVDSVEEADALAGETLFSILSHAPRLQSDWPSDAEKAWVYWVGRDK